MTTKTDALAALDAAFAQIRDLILALPEPEPEPEPIPEPEPDPVAGVLRFATTVKGELSDLDGATVDRPWIVLEPSLPRGQYDKALFYLDNSMEPTHTGDFNPPHTMLWPQEEGFLDVPEGEHTVLAELVMKNGTKRTATATFTVKRPVVEPIPETDPGKPVEPIPGGRTFFVATGGNDGRDGLSREMAWATPQHAEKQLGPGDVVKVSRGGTFTGPLELTTPDVIWMADPDTTGPNPVFRVPQSDERTVCLTVRGAHRTKVLDIDIGESGWFGVHVIDTDDFHFIGGSIRKARKVGWMVDGTSRRSLLKGGDVCHIGLQSDYDAGRQDQHCISIRTDAGDAGGHVVEDVAAYDPIEDVLQPNGDMAGDDVLVTLRDCLIGRDRAGKAWPCGEGPIDLKGSSTTILEDCVIDGREASERVGESIVDHQNGSRGRLELHRCTLFNNGNKKGARVNFMDVLVKDSTFDCTGRACADFGGQGSVRIEGSTFIRRGGHGDPGIILKGGAAKVQIIDSVMHIAEDKTVMSGNATGEFTRKPL